MSTQFGRKEATATPATGEHSPAPWKASVVAERALVIANDAINDEYRHLVVSCGEEAARAKPGQFFQLLCPLQPRFNKRREMFSL